MTLKDLKVFARQFGLSAREVECPESLSSHFPCKPLGRFQIGEISSEILKLEEKLGVNSSGHPCVVRDAVNQKVSYFKLVAWGNTPSECAARLEAEKRQAHERAVHAVRSAAKFAMTGATKSKHFA